MKKVAADLFLLFNTLKVFFAGIKLAENILVLPNLASPGWGRKAT
jgi:hypothetical protein